MPEPLDFEKLVGDISNSRNFLQTAAESMRGEQRKNFDTLLKGIDIHFEKMKVEVPKCQQMFVDKYVELKNRHEQNVADLAVAKEKYEQALAQMEAGELPEPEPQPETPVDVKLGNELRNELLNKFSPRTPTAPPTGGVAWQDWSLGGNWNTT